MQCITKRPGLSKFEQAFLQGVEKSRQQAKESWQEANESWQEVKKSRQQVEDNLEAMMAVPVALKNFRQ